MSDKIVNDLVNIKNLREKILTLRKTGMFDIISHKMVEDANSLDWAIGELIRIHFIPAILCASDSPTMMDDLANLDGIVVDGAAMFVCIAPTKVEAAVLRRYFTPVDVKGTIIRIEDTPSYLLCDGYQLHDKLIYIEGFILNKHIEEVGKRGVREQLSNWLRELLKTHNNGRIK